MSKQWWLAGGIVGALAVGGYTLSHTQNGGVVGVDSAAPDFHAYALAKGDTVDFRDAYRGQVTLVNVWATWCAPCRDEMPSMQALYRDYESKGFKIAAVSIDKGTTDEVRAFANELHLTFDILHDQSGNIQGLYQTTGVPESFLLDRRGHIVRRLIGSHDWNSPANRDLIDRLLADGS
ncbi:MAG: TlpA family protein disulfide reductase [Gemmatimonadetes bacterium]|nr:TlpA family protein disulfide reductase [Gemmatimonadota bacterium]